MPKTPKPILIAAALISAFVLVTVGFGLVHAIQSQASFRIGFESVLLIASLMGLLTGLGRFRSSTAMALMCVAGVVVFCSFFSYLTRGGRPAAIGMRLLVDLVSDPFTAARLASGVTLALLSILTIVLREPTIATKRFVLGIALLAPVVGGLALWRVGSVANAISSLHPLVLTAIGFVAFFLTVALVSSGVHFLIRSIEAGVDKNGSSTH
jgi:hypothetical protein